MKSPALKAGDFFRGKSMSEIYIREWRPEDEAATLVLYAGSHWMNYANHPERLQKAYLQSIKSLTAWDGERMVGAIRAVGDGVTVLYIQDLLVLPAYQNRGIGSELLQSLLQACPDVEETVLLTPSRPETERFYRRNGLKSGQEMQATAFMRVIPVE